MFLLVLCDKIQRIMVDCYTVIIITPLQLFAVCGPWFEFSDIQLTHGDFTHDESIISTVREGPASRPHITLL